MTNSPAESPFQKSACRRAWEVHFRCGRQIDPEPRAEHGPFSSTFLSYTKQRGEELVELIARNDAKYHRLADDAVARNPFGFSREPEDAASRRRARKKQRREAEGEEDFQMLQHHRAPHSSNASLRAAANTPKHPLDGQRACVPQRGFMDSTRAAAWMKWPDAKRESRLGLLSRSTFASSAFVERSVLR